MLTSANYYWWPGGRVQHPHGGADRRGPGVHLGRGQEGAAGARRAGDLARQAQRRGVPQGEVHHQGGCQQWKGSPILT